MHQSNLTLSYNDAMFTNTTTLSENLSVMAYYNDVWTEITPASFNNSTKEITINANLPEEAYLFFKINGTLSVKDINLEQSIKMYPNPATSNITISSEKKAIKNITIYTILGKKVLFKNVENTLKVNLNTNQLSKGIYVVKINSEDKIISKKIIIK